VKQLAELNEKYATLERAREFYEIARLLMATKGDLFAAKELADQGSTERVRRIFSAGEPRNIITRAAVGAQSQSNSSALVDFQATTQGFLNSLQTIGIFDALLVGGARRLPLRTATIGVATVSAIAATLSEGTIKPLSKLTITGDQLVPTKAAGLCVLTTELAKYGTEAIGFIGRDLRDSVVAATDEGFLAILLSGVSIATSTGSTAVSFRTDVASMLNLVPTGNASRLYLLTTPLVCKNLSMMGGNGSPCFPELSPSGGMIQGIPVLASDKMVAGRVVLVDAASLLMASGDVTLDNSDDTLLNMSDTPDSPPSGSTTMIGTWQNNLSVVRAERWWAAERMRTDAVACTLNVNSYGSGFSPP
jgi:hypothetical protein